MHCGVFYFIFFLRIYFDLLSFRFSFYFSVKLRHNELLYWNPVYTESSQSSAKQSDWYTEPISSLFIFNHNPGVGGAKQPKHNKEFGTS